MAGNFLKYTGLTYEELLAQIKTKMAADPRMSTFLDASFAQELVEIITGSIDLCNYYIERQAEESFFDTMLRLSSAIKKSRDFGYIVTRPIPAEAKIKISLQGNFIGKIYPGYKLQIPVFSVFSYGSKNFVLNKGFTYTFSTKDYENTIELSDDFSLDLTLDDDGNEIVVSEGQIKNITIEGATNPQVGNIFQTYQISDTTFSNKFGDADFKNYPITKVWVGSQSDENIYKINRRSLINDDTIAGIINNEAVKCCVIRTSVDQGVDIRFGDAKIAELGAKISSSGPMTTFDNIYVQYFSTLGSKGNETGLIGIRLSPSSSVYINGQNLTDQVVFYFDSNLTGGADIDTIDDIKESAPAIYYSLDRLVSKQDYVNYLKTLTSPINVKNAMAWGEQEEADSRGVTALVQFFNVVFFSCLGNLYITDTDVYSARNSNNRLSDAVLDTDFEEDGVNQQGYFNLFAKNNVAAQLKEYKSTVYSYQLLEWSKVYEQATSIASRYNTDTTLPVVIKSDKHLPNVELQLPVQVNISLCAQMSNIASVIQSKLRTIIDNRSNIVNGQELNTNFGNLAIPNVSVVWDDKSNSFKLYNGIDDPCYFDSMYDPLIFGVYGLAQDLGMCGLDPQTIVHAIKVFWTETSKKISSRIIDVVNTLNSKSQFTTKHIYIAPILQNFDLVGNIYVNQLFDINDVKTRCNNAIYLWASRKLNLNSECFLSDIIEIIENTNGVDHSSVKLVPKNLTVTDETFYLSKSGYQLVDKNEHASLIYAAVDEVMNQEFGLIITGADRFYVWSNFINQSKTLTSDQTFSDQYLKKISERYFHQTFMKRCYDNIKFYVGYVGDPFYDSIDFVSMMSDIHKDLSFVIRNNMIDSNGNIAPEYKTNKSLFGIVTKSLLRGGYSLGCEISKLNVATNFIYK